MADGVDNSCHEWQAIDAEWAERTLATGGAIVRVEVITSTDKWRFGRIVPHSSQVVDALQESSEQYEERKA